MIKEKVQGFITDLQICVISDRNADKIYRELDNFSQNGALMLPDTQYILLREAIDILFFAKGDVSRIKSSVNLLKQLRDELPC